MWDCLTCLALDSCGRDGTNFEGCENARKKNLNFIGSPLCRETVTHEPIGHHTEGMAIVGVVVAHRQNRRRKRSAESGLSACRQREMASEAGICAAWRRNMKHTY